MAASTTSLATKFVNRTGLAAVQVSGSRIVFSKELARPISVCTEQPVKAPWKGAFEVRPAGGGAHSRACGCARGGRPMAVAIHSTSGQGMCTAQVSMPVKQAHVAVGFVALQPTNEYLTPEFGLGTRGYISMGGAGNIYPQVRGGAQ